MIDNFIPYIGVFFIGLLHGIEPSHGSPIAVLYASKFKSSYRKGVISALLIGAFHFLSSIVAVIIYVGITFYITLDPLIFRIIGAILLIILAVKYLLEKPESEEIHDHYHEEISELKHDHPHQHPNSKIHTHLHSHFENKPMTLWNIAVFAFILGFAHEEEFALLGFALGGIDPYLLMISYGTAVILGLIGIVLVGIKFYSYITQKNKMIEKYIPKINAIILIIMAILLFFEII